MIIRLAKESDLQELTDIYNYDVLNSTSTLDLYEKSLEDRKIWFNEHTLENHHPILVAEEDGEVLGYSSLSTYRPKEAYFSTAELSIYVAMKHRRKGVASELLEAIIDYARNDPTIHTIVSVIISGNQASTSLHRKFHFKYCGTIHQVGKKFGKYQNIDTYELVLE